MCNSFSELVLSLLIISAILIVCLNGKNLISHTNNLALIKEIYSLSENVYKFKTKYTYYPGDFPFAHTLWQSGDSGNGDGYVRDYNESLHAWHQVENAKLLNLDFVYKDNSHARIEENMIKSKYTKCGYQILADRKLNNLHYYFKHKMNFLRLARDKSFGNLSKSCLVTNRTYMLDKKIDDGNPVSGKFFSDTGYSNNINQGDCVCRNDELDYFYCKSQKINCIVQIKMR